jgi:hypothetical protein
MGYSEASSPISLGDILSAVAPLQECLLVRTRRHSVKVRHFLRVARAHQPEESLRAFMDPLADALCCAAKWLESSFTHFGE